MCLNPDKRSSTDIFLGSVFDIAYTVSLASWFSFGIGMTVIIQAKGTKRPRGIRRKKLISPYRLEEKELQGENIRSVI